MKILKIILIGIGFLAFAYCLTAFCLADFNFKNWKVIDRITTEVIGIVLASFGIYFVVLLDNAD